MKRVFDFFVSSAVLLLVSPILVVLALVIRCKLGSPVFYRQMRPGLNGKPFMMIKFRSMTDQYGADGLPLSDEERLTSFGKLLRSTSLDELPELWNVVRGQMSLVGPRPLLMEYLPLYSAEQARRHEVRPGLTGWAQINGRNQLDWEDRFRLDVWYVDHHSFWLDIKILAISAHKVFARHGINASGEATMRKFIGSK